MVSFIFQVSIYVKIESVVPVSNEERDITRVESLLHRSGTSKYEGKNELGECQMQFI